MKSTGFVTIALLLTAATAQAQYGGMGGMGMGRGRGGDRDGRAGRAAPPAPPSREDVERRDPILVLMANRAALALTDSETLRLEGLDATLMEKNRPLLAQYDSVLALMPASPAGGGGSGDADDGQSTANRVELFRVLRDVRANYHDAEQSALAALAPDQRARAAKILAAAQPKEPDLGPDGGRRP